MTKLPSADIIVEEDRIWSPTFDDIYFQPSQGLQETTHVFLQGNDLEKRFQSLQPGEQFIIAELGYGTGLNFLAAADLFERVAPRDAQLHFWSVEGFPIPFPTYIDVLKKISDWFPSLTDIAEKLVTSFPTPRPGISQRRISDQVTLTLNFGDVEQALQNTDMKADAWFLDGFAPAKNSAMWSEKVFSLIAEHTAPGGSAATFTVAGDVRRGMAANGFQIEKRKGFGKKREMLCAQFPGTRTKRPIRKVAIIGAGIAGASLAFHGRKAGLDITVFDENGPASGASGNPVGLLMPRVEVNDSASARFYRDAFLYAIGFFARNCPEAISPIGGIMRRVPEAKDRFERLLSNEIWADTDLSLTHHGDLFVHQGACLAPATAVRQLLQGHQILQERVQKLIGDEGKILVRSSADRHFDAVFVANGQKAGTLVTLGDDLTASRGQLDVFDHSPPQNIITDGSYIAPFGEQLATGATYDDISIEDEVAADSDSTNRNTESAERILGHSLGRSIHARASVRAVSHDKHPIAGTWPSCDTAEMSDENLVKASSGEHQLHVLTGLGSRGLSTGPYLAAHLISQFVGGVSPFGKDGHDLISPMRFAKRRLRKRSR